MFTLISIPIVVAAVLLILVVLIQNPKGGGIASNFSAGNNIMGVKRTTDFIEKLTWGLAIGIIVLTLSSNAFVGTSTSEEAPKSIMQEQYEDAPAAPVQGNQVPGGQEQVPAGQEPAPAIGDD